MNLRKFTIVPMFAMALFAVGCGPDCESQCEDANECEGPDNDCAKDCEELEKAIEKAGCEDQYDDYLSCVSDLDDVCKASASDCKSENDAFGKCMGFDEVPM